MSLSVDFMGIKLKNPIIVAASPLSGNGSMISKAIDAGAGAVVTQTIANEVRLNVRPRIAANSLGMQNIELYSNITLEEWEREIYYVKEKDAVVIANILAHTPSEMAYIAKKVERFGVDAIELGISIPHGEGVELLISNIQRLYNLTKMAVDSVNIPVMVKLSPNVSNLTELAKVVEEAGASAISAIDTIRAIIGVDIDKGKAMLPTYGGYSGEGIRPIALATVAGISQAVKIPVSGIGGIENYKNVIEYIMLGASTVQLCTSLIMNGYGRINEILGDLENWLEHKGFNSLDEIRGQALSSLKSFEEISIEPYIAKVSNVCNMNDCNICIKSCMYGAISTKNDIIVIDDSKCTGCGLCVSLCKKKFIYLDW
ncbi:dihydroorotate dehydrogenase family protein [Proteiniborus sp. DW1]|uniref:tRNA-dihydrouridine synthase n=1 Tax=Proteiniborus sp. DW1 TaxID=1889883 RepID=UPI00092E0F68|nr:tRNA-dihydrouridine synthase [Proteiniborus sp. DW1]SCG82359.1 dihydroorotate dehydrogenase family protein [Proteiniborus sp. DW1]